MKDKETEEELVTLAARLSHAREKAGLTKEEMASRLDTPIETYAQWEMGTVEPDTETVRRAAGILHVTGNYLLFGQFREEMVGAMFPNKATPAVLPGWYRCMMAGAALLFCGGAGMLLLLFWSRSKGEGGGLLSYFPFQVFLGICIVGAILCITALILRHRNKTKKQLKEPIGNGKETKK